MTKLLIDSYNLIHRSRFNWGGGLATGKNQIVYNFFKSLKPILDNFSPERVYFILDGKPKKRLEMDSEYKANRKIVDPTDEEAAYWASFHSQKRVIIDSVKEFFPFTTAYHPDYECDDILNYLAVTLYGDKTIISSDTDFIQTLDLSDKVSLWNPIEKSYRTRMDVDYTSYKSLVGDKTDNIPGVKGVGKVGAVKMLKDKSIFNKKMQNKSFADEYNHSYNLVKFADLSKEKDQILFYKGILDRDKIFNLFETLELESMTKDKYFNSFISTLENINMES